MLPFSYAQRADVARYAGAPEAPDAAERGGGGESVQPDESGWKLVHGDVFRPPPLAPLLASLLGTGAQVCALVATTAGATFLGALSSGRGGTVAGVALASWALTSPIAGFVSGAFNARCGGHAWIGTCLLTASLLPCFAVVVGGSLNTIAIGYGSLAALPAHAIVSLIAIWLFVSCPLTLIGTLLGRHSTSGAAPPCRVRSIPRPVPPPPWFASPLFLIVAGGALPFGAIFIELHFLFVSFWGGRIYVLWGFFLLVSACLVAVTVCVASVATYALLNAENHRWHWPAFLSSASVGVYIFAYAAHFFAHRTDMSGLLQTAWYFGTCAALSAATSLAAGAAGYAGAAAFVRRVYASVKTD